MLKIQEKILLYQAKRGNQAAFARLCSEYREKIFRFIYFKISNLEKAQDLTHDVFLKILDYLANGGEIKDFRCFLYQTARNLITDFYRLKDKQDLSLDELNQEIQSDIDLNKKIDIKLDLIKIEEALKKIPDRYREVIILRFIEEMSFKEIAKITNEKPDNLRQIAHRGLKLLRQQLQAMSQL